MKNAVRVLGKCQDRGKRPFIFCLPDHIAQKFLMAEMKPVEIPERQNNRPG